MAQHKISLKTQNINLILFLKLKNMAEEEEISSCLCRSTTTNECCLCFEKMCEGEIDANLCFTCKMKLNEKDQQGYVIHPLERTRMMMCICGKPWNNECGAACLMNSFTVDPDRLAQCQTPAQRLALLSDSTAMIPISHLHGLKK